MLDKVIEIDHEFCGQYGTIVVYKLRHFSHDTNWCHSLVVECLTCKQETRGSNPGPGRILQVMIFQAYAIQDDFLVPKGLPEALL